jgi:hypothetical protein
MGTLAPLGHDGAEPSVPSDPLVVGWAGRDRLGRARNEVTGRGCDLVSIVKYESLGLWLVLLAIGMIRLGSRVC